MRKNLGLWIWLLFFFLRLQGVALSFQVAVEYRKAPGCSAFAEKSKALMEEWYPKINEILFGSGHPLPADSITLVCEPMKAIAYSDIEKNRIHISSAFVAAHPLDYGTVIHELTHIVQHYAKLKREGIWLQEGIADYIRHQYYEQDMDTQVLAVDPDQDSYRQGYRVAAAFLSWVEKQNRSTLIQDLNRHCADGHCSDDLFASICGKNVDTLWAEFASDLKSKKPATH
jgi:Peptidase of plants and bacteria